ncbi:MAG: TVP38/TMEM64 family protein [Alphaproteobacteria bacterium]|nr:TVP38/TMEM64 family protein [Alphaproteobacteria bacterium]
MSARAAVLRVLAALSVAAAALWLAFDRDTINAASLARAVHDLGPWAPLAHVALFAVATVLFVPGAVFGVAGGVMFGPWWGTLLNLAGATLGATASFLLARHLVGDWARRKAGGRIEKLVAGVEAEGWRFVAFTRLVPLFPFNLLNYALGLTRVPLGHYLLASLICMAPGTLAIAWLGHAGRSAIAGDGAALRYALIALALLAAAAFLPRLARRLRARTELGAT